MEILASTINALSLAKAMRDVREIEKCGEALMCILKSLCHRRLKLHIEPKSNTLCDKCSKPGPTCRTPCFHDICKTCIHTQAQHISAATFDSRIRRTNCPICCEELGEEGLLLFYTKSELEDMIAKGEASQRVMRMCPICLCEFDVEKEGIMLECEHMFNELCVIEHIKAKVKEGKIGDADLSCPLCSKGPINDLTLIPLAKKAGVYDQLIKFRMNTLATRDEFFKGCPRCDYGMFIPKSATTFRCVLCKISMCPNCNEKPHSGPCSSDTSWMKGLGLVPCPSCQVPIEKRSGCNFVYCASPICAGKTSFCYLCGCAVSAKDHYAHYKKKGPYGKFCNNTEAKYLAEHPAS